MPSPPAGASRGSHEAVDKRDGGTRLGGYDVKEALAGIAGEIAPMDPHDEAGAALPLPQMGWNGLDFAPGAHPLLDGVAPGDHAYFVHSYAWRGAAPADLLATTDYGGPVPAMLGRGNVVGTQFHVEKSAAVGLRILGNFLAWKP